MMCLAPLLLVGVMSGVQTSWHHHEHNPQGEILEVHSCLVGPSLVGTLAPSSGLYGLGLEWGFNAFLGPFSVGFAPQVGISHASQSYRELPMVTQFEVGGWVYGSYERFVMGLKYWHMSNAGMHSTERRPNTGLDVLAVMGGWVFK